jgi:hypothetical protein
MEQMIGYRIPPEVGKDALPAYPAVATPWNKLLSFHDAYHYALRHNASVAAAFMQVLRIVIPDYDTRARSLCEVNYGIYNGIFSAPAIREYVKERMCVHPFIKGNMTGVLTGDQGDEGLCMAGRVNDYGPFRFEKELDTCPWDIVGSEYCRCTTYFFQACSEAYGEPQMEYHMVEAKGCGDLHCRVVGENREKYPLPPKKAVHETFGPIATADQIKFTPQEKCVTEPQHFRPECGFKYRNGLCAEWTAAELHTRATTMPLGSNNVIPVLIALEPDKAKTENVIKCVFEAAGKMAFSEFAAIKGIRDWLGVPGDVKDGRVLGGLIEVVLQSILCEYTVQTFNEDEVVLDINLTKFERGYPLLTTAYLSMWLGMSKTLVGSQWSVWRETEGIPQETLRLKIGKKIDKYC